MEFIFAILSLLVIGSALAVVLLRNPLYSALCLVLNLFAVAGLYALLDAHFLATVQIIVYAGAIMVLVLFLIMLLNVKVEERSGRERVLLVCAIAIGAVFFTSLMPLLRGVFRGIPEHQLSDGKIITQAAGTTAEIGRLLYTKYVFVFEAASALIMAAIVGAVMLAKRSYRRGVQ